jgi:arsenite-transporting ATPase
MLWQAPTRILLFTGKGGVGKTTLACATAVALADEGKRVLLVSTDPASNLDEVLGVTLTSTPTPIPALPNLEALNIDPEAAAHAYRERVVAPYRGVLPDAALTSIEEQLSGACTVEIAAFDEFTKILADPGAYDHVIFDTAPTGHTLRLLKLPAAWTQFLSTNSSGVSCLGPLAGLQTQQQMYARSLSHLTDAGQTTVVLVSHPTRAALREAARTHSELTEAGITHIRLALNSVFRAASADPVALALEARTQRALQQLPESLRALPRHEFPAFPFAPIGIPNLRRISQPAPGEFEQLLNEIEAPGHGIVFTMGKGGVGKTTVAAAIAVALAERGHSVHLTTTDPAAHIADAVGGPVAGLSVSRIDPVEATRQYTAGLLQASPLDPSARSLLEEDLRSPCTEEIAVFRAFADVVAEGRDGFVILDTAPTGHTLLLLDAAEAYHREVTRTASETPEPVRELLPTLRDPAQTRILLVALPEATPVHEAARLQADLRRAGIEPFAWVINQSFQRTHTQDPNLLARAEREQTYIDEVRNQHARRVAVLPWTAEEPTGPQGLRHLIGLTSASGQLDPSPLPHSLPVHA